MEKWTKVSDELILRTPVMEFIRRKIRLPGEQAAHDFYVIGSRDWCNVIPVTSRGTVILARQYRVGLEAMSLELPGGICDPGDKSPETSALRELAEETGYAPAEGARLRAIGFVHPNPAIMGNRSHLFVAGPVERAGEQSLDPQERIQPVEVPIEAIPEMLASGDITHTIMINAFALLLFQNPGRTLPEILSEFSRKSP